MALRLVQGLLIPAMLTSLMTYTSQVTARSDMARAMSWYIAATILGGFAGRALSGLIASLLHWRFSFLFLGIGLLVAWFWLGRIADAGAVKIARPDKKAIGKIWADPVVRTTYAMVFCFFLVFAAMMNYLPFRLTELSSKADEFRIGLAYSGYLMGIVVSLNAVRIHRRCGGPERVMVGGLVFFVLALLVMMRAACCRPGRWHVPALRCLVSDPCHGDRLPESLRVAAQGRGQWPLRRILLWRRCRRLLSARLRLPRLRLERFYRWCCWPFW